MDSGLYMCKAISETGETTWSAALTVEGNIVLDFSSGKCCSIFQSHLYLEVFLSWLVLNEQIA